jgi:tetratricopeptide (TPR) repeat protein
MAEIDTKHSLADLAVDLGLLTSKMLEDALAMANETSMPLRRVLVMSNLLSEEDITNLARCQTLLRERSIEMELANQAMQRAREKRIGLDESLLTLGWDPLQYKESGPLGKLLLQAHFVTKEQLESAVQRHEETGLPLGRVLVLSGSMPESLLSAAVNAQILVRDGKLTQEQAVEALKEARRRQVSIETSLQEKGFYDVPNQSAPRIGEMLLFSGAITQSELVIALEVGLVQKKPIGEVLLQANLVTQDVLDGALQVQKLLSEQKLSINEAKSVLSAMKSGASFVNAMNSVSRGHGTGKSLRLSLSDFLKLIGYTTANGIAEAFEVAQHNSQILMQVLTIGGMADENSLMQAEHCRMLVQNGRLSLENAALVFDYARRRNMSVQEALRELHWQSGDDASFGDLKPLSTANAPKDLEQVQTSNLYATAERFANQREFEKAREIWEQLILIDSDQGESSCRALDAIAETYLAEQNIAGAKKAYERALASKEKHYGDQALQIAYAMSNLGKIAYFERSYPEAEEFARSQINITERHMGAEHPDVACGWQNLATLYHMQGKHQLAESAYKRGIFICSKSLGDEHPTTERLKKNYATLLHGMDKISDSKRMDPYARVRISGSWRAVRISDDQSLRECDD